MKRKLISGILTLMLILSASVPVYAADCQSTRRASASELLGQILCRYTGGCGTDTEQQIDWNALLRRWLDRTPAEEEQPVEPEQPAEPEQSAEPEQPSESEQPMEPEQPAEQEKPVEQEAPPAGVDASVRAYEQEVVRLVNEERAKHGLAALTEDESLSDLARRKSQDMRDNGYFDHNSPTYGSPFQMMKSFGITYRTAGENIAMGYRTPEAVVNAWMNSSGHRANILNASYTKIGVGYVAAGNYWTQEFIG